MLSSIHPLGERGRGFEFSTTATAFIVGSAVGGLTTGAAFGAIGHGITWALAQPGSSAKLAVLAFSALTAAMIEWRSIKLPSVERQVNEDWLSEYRGWVYGIGFGFQLGTGLLTYVTSAAVLLWLTSIVLAGSISGSLIIGIAFGLSRGLSILSVSRVQSPQDLVRFHRSLAARAGLVARIGSLCLIGLGVFAGIVALVQSGKLI